MYYDLNEKTTVVYMFICDFNWEHGYSPTVREIGKHVGLKSTSSIQAYLKKLEECGYIARLKDCPRTIKIC